MPIVCDNQTDRLISLGTDNHGEEQQVSYSHSHGAPGTPRAVIREIKRVLMRHRRSEHTSTVLTELNRYTAYQVS